MRENRRKGFRLGPRSSLLGRLLLPPMPFTSWRAMSDDDARAIVAYLRTVPPVRNAVSRDGNRVLFLLRLGVKLGLLHHAPAHDVKAPSRSDRRAYVGYLAKLGLCQECHSLGKRGPSEDEDVLMSGSRRPLSEPEYGRVYARNLAPDLETGLYEGSRDGSVARGVLQFRLAYVWKGLTRLPALSG